MHNLAEVRRKADEIHTKKLDGVVFKVDLEKAYDKVKWPFLQ